MSLKLEFKDVNNNYNLGLSVFVKETTSLGFKPSLTVSSIHLSFPIVVARHVSFAKMPLKLILGLFSLAGLLFYNWSEDDDTKDDSTKAQDRYKDACNQWNSARNKVQYLAERRLRILAAFAWDSSLKDVQKTVCDLMKQLCFSLRKINGEQKMSLIKQEVLKATPTTFDLTEELSSSIYMDSICIRLDDPKLNFMSSAPKIDPSNKIFAAVFYEIDDETHLGYFENQVLIGRKP